MFYAINSRTGEKVNSLSLESNASYQLIKDDIWYADIDEIDSCPNNLDINKIEVRHRDGKEDAISCLGNKYDISPHFYIPNKEKLGINTIPENKEHKLAKNWIYNIIVKRKGNFYLNYASISKPIKYKEKINILDLPFDIERIGIEVSVSTFGNKKTRRADVICPFIVKHPLFGNGIVFEIQFSNQKGTTKIQRELDWSIRGYSICWLFKKDFEEISNSIISLKNDNVDVSSFSNLININNQSLVKNLRYTVQELCSQLDIKNKELIENSVSINDNLQKEKEEVLIEVRNKKFEKLNIDKKEIENIVLNMFEKLKQNIQPRCPKCNSLMLLKKGGSNHFWGCGNYPLCKCTMSYLE